MGLVLNVLGLFVCFSFPGTARNGPDKSGPADAYTGSTSNYYVHTGKVSGGYSKGGDFSRGREKRSSANIII